MKLLNNLIPAGRVMRVAQMSGATDAVAGPFAKIMALVYAGMAGFMGYLIFQEIRRPSQSVRTGRAVATVVSAPAAASGDAGRYDVTYSFVVAETNSTVQFTEENVALATAVPPKGDPWPTQVRYDPKNPAEAPSIRPLEVLWKDVGGLAAIGLVLLWFGVSPFLPSFGGGGGDDDGGEEAGPDGEGEGEGDGEMIEGGGADDDAANETSPQQQDGGMEEEEAAPAPKRAKRKAAQPAAANQPETAPSS